MSRRIIVVDDSRTICVQLSEILTEVGYDVVAASGGQQALAIATEFHPSLVILDIQMPEMDGYTVCQRLKALGDPYDQIPVVFLTSLESRALHLLGVAMGAYLKKPVDRNQLLEVVGRVMEPANATS